MAKNFLENFGYSKKKNLSPVELYQLLEQDINDDFLENLEDSDEELPCDDETYLTNPVSYYNPYHYTHEEIVDNEYRHNESTVFANLWTDTSDPSLRKRFPFTVKNGVGAELQNCVDPLEIFQSFVSPEMISKIVFETNSYAELQIKEKTMSGKMRKKSRDFTWISTNIGEMYVYISLVILQNIMKKPSLNSYHSTNPLILTPIFNQCISRDRFALISKFLHFSNKESEKANPLHELENIYSYLVFRFQSNYLPDSNISIEESMLFSKGRVKWRRYVPITADKFGAVQYICTETKTGYVWNMLADTEKETDYLIKDIGLTQDKINCLSKQTKIVLKLIQPLLNNGYVIGLSNFYTSPELFKILVSNKTDAIGTVNCNKKMLCPLVKEKKLEKGQTVARYDGKIMYLKWKDKMDVHILSTIYDGSMTESKAFGKKLFIPDVCMKYKKHHIGKTDLLDELISIKYLYYNRTNRIFFRLIDITIKNSHVVYMKNGGSKNLLDFKLELIQQIVEILGQEVVKIRKNVNPPSIDVPSRLIGSHFPAENRAADSMKKMLRQCAYCSLKKERKRTSYSCDACNVGLCIVPCFKLYHTVENLPVH